MPSPSRKQQAPVPVPTATGAGTPGTPATTAAPRARKPMTQSHRQKLSEAMRKRMAGSGSSASAGNAVATSDPIQTLLNAAAARPNRAQVQKALAEIRRQSAILEAILSTTEPEPERTMSAGGSSNAAS